MYVNPPHQNSRNLRTSAGGSLCLTVASLLIKLVNMGNKASAIVRVLTVPREQPNSQHVTESVSNMWPFSANLPRELNVGDKIEIEGKLADDAEVFSINLVCHHNQTEKPHNIAYHYKVHFSQMKTISNAKIEGTWQEEEVKDEVELLPGEHFQISLFIDKDAIYTYFKENNIDVFDHKIPIQDVKYLQIWDGIEKIDSMKITFA
ncbi:galectin-2 isoform X2 [Arctopsyche grandis]|uniref:galectin-2 isoform X2 n=2 Tax=Arctopsyche grandis TaxID=121162 RepID=UPI00406D73E1